MAEATSPHNLSDADWHQYQNQRFPGTQEIIETRQGLRAEIYEFVDHAGPAAKLFELLDPSLEGEADPGRRLAAYEHVCEQRFDFRRGPNGEVRERQDIEETLKAPREAVGAELWDTTFDVCGDLGMVHSSELTDGDNIAHIGILGGTEGAISNRVRYAVEQLTKHQAAAGSLDFLVAEKELGFALKEAARLGVTEEVSREEHPDGTVVTFEPIDINGRQVPVRVLVGKANGGRDRATTLDTMKLWSNVAGSSADERLVAVTTGLYTAFQNANAREVLTWQNGAVVEVIGHSAEWTGGERYANQLLQELKAAVDSRWRLYQKLVETGQAPAIEFNEHTA